MTAAIFEPSERLKSFVECYWNLEATLASTPIINHIVPDGTMKLIFHYGDTYRYHPPLGHAYLLPKCFLIGQLTRPFVVEPTGFTGSFVVRFHPHGFLPFSTIPFKQILNKAIPIEQLFGEKGHQLGQRILFSKNHEERIQIMEAFLLDRLANTTVTDSIVASAIATFRDTHGILLVQTYSHQIDVHRKQLTRKLSSNTGLTPKQLAKTLRIQSALNSLLKNQVSSLTDLAYENEYFDQSHFIKDFKAFTGITPKAFDEGYLKMSLIFDTLK